MRKTVPLGVTAQNPHYMGLDRAGKYLFVTTAASSTDSPGILFDFKALCSDSDKTGLLNSQSAANAGQANQWKGAALSDELGLILCGSGDAYTAGSAQKRSVLSMTNYPWAAGTTASAATLTAWAGINLGFDNASFNHDSTKVFSNLYQQDGSDENPDILTWTITGSGVTSFGLTIASDFPSVYVSRVRSVNSYYIKGQDLVYYGEGLSTNGSEVCVYNASTATEKLLISTLPVTGSAIIQVKVACAGSTTPYLHVQLENGTIIVYALNADGLGLASATPVATVDLPALLGISITQLRSFEVSPDGTALVAAPGMASSANSLYVIASQYGLIDATIAANETRDALWPFRIDYPQLTGVKNFSNRTSANITMISGDWAPMAVYQSERWGNGMTNTFSNLIPNAPYRIEYHGADTYSGTQHAGDRIWDMWINNVQVLTNMDLYATVGGYTAFSKSFLTTADGNGQIAISFKSSADNPKYGALAIFGQEPPTNLFFSAAYGFNTNIVTLSWTAMNTLAYYVETAATADGPWSLILVDQTNKTYSATLPYDTAAYYRVTASNGIGTVVSSVAHPRPVFSVYALNVGYALGRIGDYFCPEDYLISAMRGAPEPNAARDAPRVAYLPDPIPAAVFASKRYMDDFTYVLPNLRTGKTYELRLYVKETNFNSTGGRVFNLDCNGVRLATGIDPFLIAGGPNVTGECVYPGLAPASDGTMTLTFSTSVNHAEICGLELLEENSDRIPLVPFIKGAYAQDNGVLLVIGSGTGDLTYQIRRKAAGGDAYETIGSVFGNAWFDAGSSAGASYSVRAINKKGAGSEWSGSTVAIASPFKNYLGVNCSDNQTVASAHGDFVPYTAFVPPNNNWGLPTTSGALFDFVRDPAPAAVYQTMMYSSGASLVFTGLCPHATYLFRVHNLDHYYSDRGKRITSYWLNETKEQPPFDVVGDVPQNAVLLQEHLIQTDAMGAIAFTVSSVLENGQYAAFEMIRTAPQPNIGASVLYRDRIGTENERDRTSGTVQSLVLNWSSGVPSGADATGNETIWDATLLAPETATYTFTVAQSGFYTLWIDDKSVLDCRNAATSNTMASASATIYLTQGGHHIRARHIQGSAPLRVSLAWSSPDLALQTVGAPYLTTDAAKAASIGHSGYKFAEIGQLNKPCDLYPVDTAVDGSTVWRMIASGSDVWAGSEEEFFAYKKISGDFEAKLRVRNLVSSTSATKLGISIRTSLSKFDGLYAYTACMTRKYVNGNSPQWYFCLLGDNFADGTKSISEMNIIDNSKLPLPRWVKISCTRPEGGGNRIATFACSADGETWEYPTTVTLPETDSIYVGVMMCGHSNDYLPVAEFDAFSVIQAAPKSTRFILK